MIRLSTIGRALATPSTLAALLLLATPVGAQEALNGFLKEVAAVRRQAAPLRATITAEIHGVQGDAEDRWTMVVRPAAGGAMEQVFVDFEKAKVRALALAPGELHLAAGGKAKKAAPDAALGATSWSVEDILPFAPERCAAMRIADLQTDQVTIICEPKRESSQYALMVWKFDRPKLVPLQVLLYKETMNNLVKMARFDDYAAIGNQLRPKRIVMQDFKLRTRDVLACEWSEAPQPPAELFDVTKFAAQQLTPE